MLKRLSRVRAVLWLGLVAVLPAPTCRAADAASALPGVTLHAPSPCIACIDWATHLRKAGFPVSLHEHTRDALDALKKKLGVPEAVHSRHTATVAGYFIEGHVPPEDILTLLAERPQALGLAVPGLPRGAPGLELTSPTCETACTMLDNDSGVRDIKRELYDTLLVLPGGRVQVWARHLVQNASLLRSM